MFWNIWILWNILRFMLNFSDFNFSLLNVWKRILLFWVVKWQFKLIFGYLMSFVREKETSCSEFFFRWGFMIQVFMVHDLFCVKDFFLFVEFTQTMLFGLYLWFLIIFILLIMLIKNFNLIIRFLCGTSCTVIFLKVFEVIHFLHS